MAVMVMVSMRPVRHESVKIHDARTTAQFKIRFQGI
jgi:hypothetical protein